MNFSVVGLQTNQLNCKKVAHVNIMLKGAQVKNGLILAFVLYFAKQIIREFQEFEDTDVSDNEISIPIQPFKAEIPMESNGAKYAKAKKKGGKKNEIELLRKKKAQIESERDVSSFFQTL